MLKIYQFLTGTVIGSFVELMVTRSLKHKSIIYPRSHCDCCKRQLRAWELIPVISFLCLRGRCATCHHPIGWESPLTEMVVGTVVASHQLSQTGLTESLFQLTLLILALFDYHVMWMPTRFITLLLIIAVLANPLNIYKDLILLVMYLILTQLNHKAFVIGEGDIDVIFILILKSGPDIAALAILLASILAIFQFVLHPQRKKIPFIPSLTTVYLIIS